MAEPLTDTGQLVILDDAWTYTIELPGGILRRGFWLYVWEVRTPEDDQLLYVGRTGDNSSPNAASAYNRMGQHLGTQKATNMLRKALEKRGVAIDECAYRFVAHGPFLAEDPKREMQSHEPLRNLAGSLEKALAESLVAVGYEVMNTVSWRWPLDDEAFAGVQAAFAEEFPKLKAQPA